MPEERVPNELAFGLLVISGSWLLGLTLSHRIRRVDGALAAATRLTAEQRTLAIRMLAEERTRIARELHDVIAHGVSVMGVQCAAARVVLDHDPDNAKQILLAVESQARESIGELQRLLSVLRAADDGTVDRRPQPGLGDLSPLFDTMRGAGLKVTLTVRGEARHLPPGADLTAYRIVQEALTNTPQACRTGRRHRQSVLGARRAPHRSRQPRTARRGKFAPRSRAARHARTHRPLRRFIGRRRPAVRRGHGQRQSAPRRGEQSMTTVLLADDQDMVRGGFRLILSAANPAITVIGEARDGAEAVSLARSLNPDVVIMGIRMPGVDGIEATRRIVRAGLPARVLVLTTFDADEHIIDAFRAGASGFLLKNAPVDQLAGAVHAVAAGDTLLSPTLTRRLIAQHISQPNPTTSPALQRLSDRERDVLNLMARGMSNQEIGDYLIVSVGTVKTHVTRLLAKLELRDRVHAVVFAYESGLITPGSNQ
jgi:DNA-binding NarL/FixJ family response regulator